MCSCELMGLFFGFDQLQIKSPDKKKDSSQYGIVGHSLIKGKNGEYFVLDIIKLCYTTKEIRSERVDLVSGKEFYVGIKLTFKPFVYKIAVDQRLREK